ncbi:MAG: hypothetical protein CMP86_11295 [Gammaproteobacteria bacterium]|nr:hypothetical protein [Gammaproteobacteria bacterium]
MVYSDDIRVKKLAPLTSSINLAQSDDNQAVYTVRQLIRDAVRYGVSDIHIEPQQHALQIRQRLDGFLCLTNSLPLTLAPRLISRIKIMAQLDIAERRLPQDGRINLAEVSGLADLRVSTVPTMWGEKAVLRILNQPHTRLAVEVLGMTPQQQEQFRTALHRPHGLILVTGPTGCGKTLTLYSGLEELNDEQRNISTIEDPIEIHLDGINQIAVNDKIGLDFSHVLRALVRQDPDVIMVGEIRDLETATAAIRAAQTGHLVLSTLHSRCAKTALTRLQQMGIESFDLTTTVSLILAQRLARRLCNYCKQALAAKTTENGTFQANPDGCPNCNRGYHGRIGIFELLPVDECFVQSSNSRENHMSTADSAHQTPFSSLRDAALTQVTAGVISLEEADRIAPD